MNRWHATITYRTAHGPAAVEHTFEEIEELHDLVERGPDWNSVLCITVTLARICSPNVTTTPAY
jgi:hypothetical protein